MAGVQVCSYTPIQNPTWQAWNNQLYNTTASTTTTPIYIPAGATWTAWNNQLYNVTSASTGSTLQAITWTAWNTTYTAYQESAEERAAREAADARRAAEWEAQRLVREAERARQQVERARATERAMELLESCLTLEQWRDYRERGYFEVISSRGRRWRIRKESQAGNVDLMPAEGDVREASFCVHPPDNLPNPDAHLAQKLQLETDEDGLLAVANVVHLRPGLRRDQLRVA